MKGIIGELEKIGCPHWRGFPMKRYTTMRLGGAAELIIYPRDSRELVTVLNLLRQREVEWTALGGGSNVIIGPRLGGVVVSTKRLKGMRLYEGGRVEMEAGAILGQVLRKCLKDGLIGLEFAAGIPGTVGGAVVMNAGANGGELKDVIECVWVWHEGREIVLTPEEIGFQYRRSHFPEGSVISRARVKLSHGDGEAGAKRVREFLRKRAETQPVDSSNSGCVFKNPPQIPAGRLLDELGLKGYRIGGASFSTLHANFIVNSGEATIEDVLELIELAKRASYTKRGIVLETEVKILGAHN